MKESMQTTDIIGSPVAGKAIPLSEVRDPVFAQEILGKGAAIIPSDGKIVSPADGTISVVAPTKHALGIALPSGCEVLIHIGIDTVMLNGEYFTPLVDKGEAVKKGQTLIEFDLEAVKANGFDPVTPVVVSHPDGLVDISAFFGEVRRLDPLIEVEPIEGGAACTM